MINAKFADWANREVKGSFGNDLKDAAGRWVDSQVAVHPELDPIRTILLHAFSAGQTDACVKWIDMFQNAVKNGL